MSKRHLVFFRRYGGLILLLPLLFFGAFRSFENTTIPGASVRAHLEASLALTGVVQTEYGNGVEGVEVILSGGDGAMPLLTNSDGSYTFLPSGDTLTIRPEKNDDHANGVSSFDVVLVTRHILGQQQLSTPYRLVAAEADGSGAITTRDLIRMRKLIQGVISEFPQNSSWRFVSVGYVFPDPEDPWAEGFPEAVEIDFSAPTLPSLNFVAIKIGDVNGSATLQGGGN